MTTSMRSGADRAIKRILREAKRLHVEYYKWTQKPLGVTGEVAEYEAAQKLKLVLAAARSPGFDASLKVGRRTRKFQIKGRAVSLSKKYGGRVPRIIKESKFDAVLLVLLDKATLDTVEIWEASRTKVLKRLEAPGSKARNERGQMGISQFRSIAKRVWPK